uniref:Uncharacterized protein n=1 Tax=Erpetoichthys calabaricus TaxID=27687 RepID=A0A8C4TKW2_ERPCA
MKTSDLPGTPAMSVDQCTCAVCQDVLKEPVTIPCGHNYCMKCINDYWDRERIYMCPQCRRTFILRPELNRNTVLTGLIENLKKARDRHALSVTYAGPDDVPCDVCEGRKRKASKTCMTCLISYCEPHLKHHRESAAFKKHKIEALNRNLEEKLCVKHHRLLEIFCRTEESCVCALEVQKHEETFETLLKLKSDVTNLIKEYEEREVEKAKDVIRQLEKEIMELKSRDAELTELLWTDDHIHFLQVNSCPLTLDPTTANQWLRLSDRNEKVTFEDTVSPCLDYPDRFDWWTQVLCREALSGTRCYWEVEWRGEKAEIGVAYKGIERKGWGYECRLGFSVKSWILSCSQYGYSVWHNKKKTEISAPTCHKIGIYLDYPAGTLSFYSISDTMTLLHRFNTSFTEPLYPGFWVGENSSVTICTLYQSDQ